MSSIQDTVTIMAAVAAANPSQALYLSGPPGVGKTTICFDLAERLGLPPERVLLFRPSLRDPVDLLGVPSVDPQTGTTAFNPPLELQRFAEGSGRGLIIWDELAQGSAMMQNAIAGALLDRELGGLRLDSSVIQVATGNRLADKAGANRVVSQLANRVLHLEVEVDVQRWTRWALGAGIPPKLIGFLQLRPELLLDFDPNRFSNPTPRAWEMVARIPDAIAAVERLYHTAVQGLVGEGAAAEWCGIRALPMPDIGEILADPLRWVPPEPAAIRFACATALAQHATPQNLELCWQAASRLSPEFETLFVTTLVSVHGEDIDGHPIPPEWVFTSRGWVEWASSPNNLAALS